MNLLTKTIILPLLGVITLSTCGSGSGKTTEAAESTATSSSINTNEQPPAAASRVLRSTNGGIPVYENFADLAPLLQQQNDTTYVVNFWATWCKPCVEELPYFERLHQESRGEKVKIVLVSLDFQRDLESKLLPFIAQNDIQSSVVVLLDGDYNSWIDKVDPQWGGAIPVTVVYNKRNRRFIGEQLPGFEELATIVRQL